MKRLAVAFLFALTLIVPASSSAYIGAGIGTIDEDNFGGGILLGLGLPMNFGLDVQLVGYADTGAVDLYWIQTNADLSYDFHEFWKKVSETIELHPYVKAGFTYGAALVDTGAIDTKASHGPGFNIGGGVDWKLLPFLTVGIDLTESFVYLDGVTVSGVQLAPDETAKVFNFMAGVKFFAY